MERPEVRIVQAQQEEVKSSEVSGYEASELLAKYGFKSSPNIQSQQYVEPNQGQTFDEMAAIQDQREKLERAKYEEERHRKMYGPRAISFDDRNVGYSEVKWSSDEETNLGIQVQIVSDMPIDENRNRRSY